MTSMLDYALAYARNGWRVFPLGVKGKKPLIEKGKGCLDATTDEEVIKGWWGRTPLANIGLATGHSFFAVDIDPRHNGHLWLESVNLPDTIYQQTGTGGFHYLFCGPPSVKNGVSSVAPGVDIRGEGGYIVAAPSQTIICNDCGNTVDKHTKGCKESGSHIGTYTWIDCDDIPTQEPAMAPGWLLDAACKKKKNGMPPVPEIITKGVQHDTLFRYASSLWGGRTKMSEAEVMAATVILSKRCEEVPPEENVEKIVHSVTRKYEPGLSPEYAAALNGHHKNQPPPEEESDEPDETPIDYVPWPEPLSELAFHGPIGALAKLIEPNTEADIAAVLFQALVMVGSVFGRGVHFMAEGTHHFCNEFVGIVGATAKGRKGSSYGQVKGVLSSIAPEWASKRTKSGLTSGEGLIFHVRDEIREIKHQKGQMVEVVTDPGEADKRMLIVEEELSSAIKAMSREGNTLSGVLRQAWDSPTVLAPMTKNNRITASFPHVSIIGHITRDELLKNLKAVENTNGGTNRFLWCCAKRSKLLPFGGRTAGKELDALVQEIDCSIGWAQMNQNEMVFDSEAAEMWSIVYEQLGDIPSGTLGAILSRAEPHVRRISMIYAAMDRSSVIRPEHLEAALEIWRYSSDSVRWIFSGTDSGESVQSKVADKIAKFIDTKPEGVSRREIGHYMGGKIKSTDIEYHLSQLLTNGKIVVRTEKRTRKSADFYYRA